MSTHLHIQEKNVNIMSFQDEKMRQVTWETVQTYNWKEKQGNLLLPKLALKTSVESLSSDNLLIGHLP